VLRIDPPALLPWLWRRDPPAGRNLLQSLRRPAWRGILNRTETTPASAGDNQDNESIDTIDLTNNSTETIQAIISTG
jgi:hypothetical protein